MKVSDFESRIKMQIHEFIKLAQGEGVHLSYQDVDIIPGLGSIELRASGSDYDAYFILDDDLYVQEWNIAHYK